jgi:hypothetical protein
MLCHGVCVDALFGRAAEEVCGVVDCGKYTLFMQVATVRGEGV